MSDIQEQIAESNAGAAIGEVAKADVPAVAPEVAAAAAQAAMIAEVVKAALENAGLGKTDPIAEIAAISISSDEMPVASRPIAEVIPGRTGQIKVYVPYDIRADMNNYGRVIGSRMNTSTNEFNYINNPAQFNVARGAGMVGGLEIFKNRSNIESYLNNLDDYNDDQDFIERVRSQMTRILEEVNAFYANTLGNISNLSVNNEFTYDELAVLLAQPGIKLVVEDDFALVCVTTHAASQQMSMSGPYIAAAGHMYARNGQEIQQFTHQYYFGGYDGKKSLKELGITPLESDAELKARLLARGKRGVEVTASSSYMQYKGDLVRRGYWSNTAFRSTGRVMIDFQAMRIMDPNYRKFFGGTQDRDSYGYTAKAETVKLSDDVYLTFSPYVYGFSFLSKVWGEMLVDNITPIQFRTDAYGKLVMDEDQKEMIVSLVETQLEGKKVDIIDGKGGGTIFLLAGEPGTGKTLTAEVTAEHLKRPLYMVGVGELGTSASELEDNLRQVLDIAATWNAVLLLDECDIFMEARTDSNIQRNAMVGVFLRLLEYYQGVLFLTSNRASNIDKAFYSRISMAINFPALTTGDRVQIWENNLNMNSVQLTATEILYLAETYEINGRQIKTATRNASALALKGKRPTDIKDFQLILNKGLEFQKAVFERGGKNDMTLLGMHKDAHVVADVEFKDVK